MVLRHADQISMGNIKSRARTFSVTSKPFVENISKLNFFKSKTTYLTMDHTENFKDSPFSPLLILFHFFGWIKLPCPESCRKREYFVYIWNSLRYLFYLVVIFTLAFKAVSVFLVSFSRTTLMTFIVLLFQTSVFVRVFRYRRTIMLLQRKLWKIFKRLHYTHRWKALKISTCVCVLLQTCIPILLAALYLKSNMNYSARLESKESPYILEGFKFYYLIIQDIWSALHILLLYALSAYLTTYFYIVCTCLKVLYLELVTQFPVFIAKDDYQTMIQVYQEITEVMIYFQDFFSYPAFINVLSSMAGLFWGSYSIVFQSQKDYIISVFLLGVVLNYFALLLAIMMPASAVNKAAKVAKNTVLSTPGWFPQHYGKLKMFICKRFKHQELALTLGKVYKIDTSLIISTLGTLISYGILVGTLGTVQKSSHNEIDMANCSDLQFKNL
ncbi:uncharacterized protein NPIL_644951 [Nephila pilipes]|uniref:Gustatory receptor n=1 Tax=Nephila pilipes TaxID=299642 RepID=A0A8X6NAB2_NEPPI|nr:uncharacterized protein NPIL_644951 [Nephila pilipes]